MKRILFVFFVLLITLSCFGAFTQSVDDTRTYKNAYRWTGKPRDYLLDWAQEVEDRLEGSVAIPYSSYTATDTEPGTTAGMLYYDLSENKFKFYNGSSWTAIEAGDSADSLDAAYSIGSAITVDNGAVVLTATNAADNIALTVAQADTGTTKAITITNAGTGNTIDIQGQGSSKDIEGTGDTWSVTSAGVGTFVGLVSSTGDVTLTGAAYNIIHDASANQLEFQDSAELSFGTNDDISIVYDGSGNDLDITGSGLEIAFGANDEGMDVYFHGETASTYALWDESADELVLELADLKISSDSQIELEDDAGTVDWTIDNATDETLLITPTETTDDQSINLGNATNTTDLRIFGKTASTVVFDASADKVLFDAYDIRLQDADILSFGDSDDITIAFDGAGDLDILGTGLEVAFGVSDDGIDVVMHGETAGEYWMWDESADSVIASCGNITQTLVDAEADQFKVDATGTVAGDAINFETTDGGIMLNADGAANGDIELNSADDVIITSAGKVTITNTEAVTVSGALTVSGKTTISAALVTPVEVVTATNTITTAEAGKTFILSSATEFASVLPTAADCAGITYRFIVGAAPSGASYTITTGNSLENLIFGLAVVNGASVAGADEDTITFTDGAAVVGDWVEVTGDGTNWYVSGQAVAATGITLTQAD